MYKNLTVLEKKIQNLAILFKKSLNLQQMLFAQTKKPCTKHQFLGALLGTMLPSLPLSHANCILINNAQSTKNAYDSPPINT
jgi:hypothetical protein